MIYKIDDIVITKKKHVCGSDHWQITRLGIEIKMKCCKCGREVLIFKADLDKKVKQIQKSV